MGKNAVEKLAEKWRCEDRFFVMPMTVAADELEKAIHDDWHGGTGWTADCRHCRDEMLWNDEQSD